ncbi:MAG TPA: folylpolyglutamate synthase/dihydrofolate synthase family protein [Candidatus Eisenbacteria bacterium]|nr:folylpolyglutamate synthase/dihydrofolate synthase family protein [Candidatus Eisenbacteria bacterium]
MTTTLPLYQAALERLFGLERGGGKLGLTGIRLLLDALGRPDRHFASTHVAGTNGKGSTSCYLERLWRETGLTTGLYTSPHLVDFRERIRVGGVAVGPDEVLESFETLSRLPEAEGRTFFEAATAIAFRILSERRVQAGVIEVGLGGRLDSTNVIEPSVCVITPVGLDHTDLLGPTLAHVAAEKAGILKAGVPAVMAPQVASAGKVIEQAAAEHKAEIVRVAQRARAQVVKPGPEGTEVRLATRDFGTLAFRLRALGRHQAANAALAVAAFSVGLEHGLRLPSGGRLRPEKPAPEALARALAQARWPGRLERSEREPRVYWDGAHNPHGARVLRRAWRQAMADQPAALVLGMSADKDARGFLTALRGPWRKVFAAPPETARAADPELLARHVKDWAVPVRTRASVAEALAEALDWVGSRGRVLVTGSLFTVGDAMRALGDPPPEALP